MGDKRSRGFKVPREATNSKHGGIIPSVATNQRNAVDKEIQCFNVGHRYYNENLGNLKNIGIAPLRGAFDKYKKISRHTTILDLRKELKFKPVARKNSYTKFFSGLEQDIDLEEFNLAQGCRAFVFVSPTNKIIEVVAISNHPETDKIKR